MSKTTPETAPTEAPKPEMVRIYNRSQREFHHGTWKARRATFSTVPKDVAEIWMKMFENDIVLASDAQKELNGAAAALVESQEKLTAAQVRIAELEAQLKGAPAPAAPKGIAKTSKASDQV